MHTAAKTSVGQCTPSTRCENATMTSHKTVTDKASVRLVGQIRATQSAALMAKTENTSACPLGKFEPQYHAVCHSAGRSRCGTAFTTYTNTALLITNAASKNASARRRLYNSQHVAISVTGNKALDAPNTVMNSNAGVRAAG